MKLSKAFLFRIAAILTVSIVALVLVLWSFCNILAPVLIWIAPSLRPALYDIGVYGPYSVIKYVSTDLESPHFSIPRWNDACDDGRNILFTPKGGWVTKSGPAIVDPRGELIWLSSEYRNAMNLNVQIYKGEKYLTFWTGEKAATSGQGVYYMLDSTYTNQYTISPHGEQLHADLHEFQVTNDNTALLTIYNSTTTAELTFLGRPVSRGYITENAFQEIDIETGRLIFEWRASEHFSLSDSYYWSPFGGLRESSPFDWFHINSLQKDRKGNYLVSSRHLHMVCCVSPTGEVLWTLGGKRNDFKDLSEGKATDFQWQHDARWVDEEKGILSIYDNGYAGPVQSQSESSRGIMLRVDVEKKTVELLHEYISMKATLSASQGSMQVLPDKKGVKAQGNVFVGWGHSAMFSEFTQQGDLLCEWHFGPSLLDYIDFVASYRVLKMDRWIGKPTTKPQAKVRGGKELYVSWNGATEVASWSLQATRFYKDSNGEHRDEGEYEEIDVMLKQGFESRFVLPEEYAEYASIRVAAMDAEGQLLGFSETVEATGDERGYFGSIVFIVGFLIAVLLVYIKVTKNRKLQHQARELRSRSTREWFDGAMALWEKWNPWSLYRYRKLG